MQACHIAKSCILLGVGKAYHCQLMHQLASSSCSAPVWQEILNSGELQLGIMGLLISTMANSRQCCYPRLLVNV